MGKKIPDEKRATIKMEYIQGFSDKGQVRVFPSYKILAERHGVNDQTIYSWSKKENWQSEKNKFHTKVERKTEERKIQDLVERASQLDDACLVLSGRIITRINICLKDDEQARGDATKANKILRPNDLRDMANGLAVAQKVGKLALGQANEIVKVAADVETPDEFRQIIAELDRATAARTQEYH